MTDESISSTTASEEDTPRKILARKYSQLIDDMDAEFDKLGIDSNLNDLAEISVVGRRNRDTAYKNLMN